MTDTKSKVLLTILILAIITSVSLTVYKTLVKQDFVVEKVDPKE